MHSSTIMIALPAKGVIIHYGLEARLLRRFIFATEHDDSRSTRVKLSCLCTKYVWFTYNNVREIIKYNKIYLNFSARKYAKWWSQCFLTGIEQILLGFRDDYGIVRQMQPLLIKDIETRAVRINIDIFWIKISFVFSVHGVQVHF